MTTVLVIGAGFVGLVEVVKGRQTSSEIFEQGIQFVKSLRKTPVRVQKDIPDFDQARNRTQTSSGGKR